jgi:uncharacterized protein YceK
MRSGLVFMLLVAILMLSGCTTLQRQSFNKEAAMSIKTLNVVVLEDETEYAARVINNVLASQGLVGALVSEGIVARQSGLLTESLDPKKTKLRRVFNEALETSLRKSGYQLANVTAVAKDKKMDDAVAEMRSRATTDAVLFAFVSAAYFSEDLKSDYLPHVGAHVKLITKEGRVLYEDRITYGQPFLKEGVFLSAPDNYRFNTIETLGANPQKARAGLLEGARAVAEHISRDIRR